MMRCGYIALVGRPNVGKSTLLNRLLGKKISITSYKPQTTRHQILGIKTTTETQIIYVDTPGLHRQENRLLNRYMNRTARHAIFDVDVVVFVIDALRWKTDDEWVLVQLRKLKIPVILAVNKVDTLTDKTQLLPWLKQLSEQFSYAAIIPISAKKGMNVEQLEQELIQYLPQQQYFFSAGQLTDRDSHFFASEAIREQLTRHLGEELPYAINVTIESFKQRGDVIHINAIVWVERTGQKAIVIGGQGSRLKLIGQKARLSLERQWQQKVFLEIWVKVKPGWLDDERLLKQLGY